MPVTEATAFPRTEVELGQDGPVLARSFKVLSRDQRCGMAWAVDDRGGFYCVVCRGTFEPLTCRQTGEARPGAVLVSGPLMPQQPLPAQSDPKGHRRAASRYRCQVCLEPLLSVVPAGRGAEPGILVDDHYPHGECPHHGWVRGCRPPRSSGGGVT